MRPVLMALAAALLYALSTPLSKVLMGAGVDSSVLAGLLYLGAGAGMGVLLAGGRALGRGTDEGLRREDAPYAVAMVALDVAAPLLLMGGLAGSSAAAVSLLNNFEIVATALIALVFFHERVSRRLWAAIAAITGACTLLSGATDASFSPASLLVLGACCCWGVENNCTSRLSARDPVQIVTVKGLGSGAGALAIALGLGAALPEPPLTAAALGLGFLSYGLSIGAYILAQRGMGAARTSAYYAVAPFAGTALSWLVFGADPSPLFLAALVLMAVGSWLALPGHGEAAETGSAAERATRKAQRQREQAAKAAGSAPVSIDREAGHQLARGLFGALRR